MRDGALLAIGALAAGGLMALIKAVSAYFSGGKAKNAVLPTDRAAEQQAATQKAEANIKAEIATKAVVEAVEEDSPEEALAALWNTEKKP